MAALSSAIALSQLAPALVLGLSLGGAPERAVAARAVPARALTVRDDPAAGPPRALVASRGSQRWEVGVAARPALEPPPARDPVPRAQALLPPAPPVARPLVGPPATLRQQGATVAILEAAAREFGQDREAFLLVAYCESRFRPDAVGGQGEVGIFQFMPRTFERWAGMLGYSPDDIWDVRAQARVAAFMWKHQQMGQWTCAR